MRWGCARLMLACGLLWPDAMTGAPMAQAPGEASILDTAGRREIVAKLAGALRERYILPDVGARAAAAIEAASGAGDYDRLVDADTFTARLSADIAAVAHDRHLRVWATGASVRAPPAARAGSGDEAALVRADKLAGGIGYIAVRGFPPFAPFRGMLDRIMAGLKGSRTLILDVRLNGGGEPATVVYLVSFLVTPGRPINDIVVRAPGTTRFTRDRYLAVRTPVRFVDVPVYVLAGPNTFSGGEEFAYDVQALGRGIVVGEVTGGGAHPARTIQLGRAAAAAIPFARAENPATKANWEGTGVIPDVRVPAGEALAVALERAARRPVSDRAFDPSRPLAPRVIASPARSYRRATVPACHPPPSARKTAT